MSAVEAGPTEVAFPLVITDITDNGVVSGNPLATSPEAGKIIAAHIGASLVGFIKEWAKTDPRVG